MRFISNSWRTGIVAGLLSASAAFAAGPMVDYSGIEPLLSVRSKDSIFFQVDGSNIVLTQTIFVSPVKVKKPSEKPDPISLIHLLISPMFIKEGDSVRPAFTMHRPLFNLSHGRIKRVLLTRPDGEPVINPEEMTPDCRYVLTVEFGHVVPDKFEVTVILQQTTGIRANAELLYNASNDGHPLRTGPAESFYTDLRINTSANLQPWAVFQGDKEVLRSQETSVRLDRDVSHTIRFAVPGR